jgi:hypothetical protein
VNKLNTFITFQVTFWSVFSKLTLDPRRKGELDIFAGEREECGHWHGDNVENIWRAGGFEPER